MVLFEPEDRLVDAIVGDLLADADEPALLDHALRPDVVERDMGRDRPLVDLIEQESQGGRRVPLPQCLRPIQ